MPTTDTWASVKNLKQNSCAGLIKVWVRTPNFGALPKDAKPVNSYTWQWRVARQDPATQYYQNTTTGVITYSWNGGFVYSGLNIDSLWYSYYTSSGTAAKWAGIENEVQLAILGKIADTKVNIAVSLAEASKTSDMILSMAKRIDSAYRAFRRGNFRKVAKVLNLTPGTVHKNWLEYKYGWTPLLMEVKGAAEFFAQQHVERKPRFVAKSHRERKFNTSRSVAYTAYGWSTPSHSYTEQVESVYTYKAKVWCELTNPHMSALQQLGITNPLLIAWELVPFSFVFDWFIQVGDYLEGLTALHGVTIRRAMQSHVLTSKWKLVYPETSRTNAGYYYYTNSLTYEFEVREYIRDPLVLNPLSLYPPSKVSFGFQKMITSLALMRGQYRGRGGLR